MREAGRSVAMALDAVERALAPGVSTAELDQIAEETIRSRGAVPSFKGFPGGAGRQDFPATICASVNAELVHGIPREDAVLQNGDILSVDVGAIFEGWHGDAARTFAVGTVTSEAEQLLEATKGALEAGIEASRSGHYVSDVSRAIQAHVDGSGFSIVREYTGHGIGRAMHEPPQILNYHESAMDKGSVLRPGMTMALEPMVNAGTWRTRVLADGWTVVPADGRLSAHFENTIVVTEDRAEILTAL